MFLIYSSILSVCPSVRLFVSPWPVSVVWRDGHFCCRKTEVALHITAAAQNLAQNLTQNLATLEAVYDQVSVSSRESF